MTETGLENFDRTLQETHLLLRDVGEVIGSDKQRHLASHMPLLVSGIYWENYKPAGKPESYRSRDEFLQKVSSTLEGTASVNPEDAVRAVLATLAQQVPEGEMEHVTQMVPEEIRVLFP